MILIMDTIAAVDGRDGMRSGCHALKPKSNKVTTQENRHPENTQRVPPFHFRLRRAV